MKKKKKLRRMTDDELREYYDRTSMFESGAPFVPVKMTFPKPRQLVAMRLDEATLEAVKRIAASKGLNYSTMIRMWITERLRKEAGGR